MNAANYLWFLRHFEDIFLLVLVVAFVIGIIILFDESWRRL